MPRFFSVKYSLLPPAAFMVEGLNPDKHYVRCLCQLVVWMWMIDIVERWTLLLPAPLQMPHMLQLCEIGGFAPYLQGSRYKARLNSDRR